MKTHPTKFIIECVMAHHNMKFSKKGPQLTQYSLWLGGCFMFFSFGSQHHRCTIKSLNWIGENWFLAFPWCPLLYKIKVIVKGECTSNAKNVFLPTHFKLLIVLLWNCVLLEKNIKHPPNKSEYWVS